MRFSIWKNARSAFFNPRRYSCRLAPLLVSRKHRRPSSLSVIQKLGGRFIDYRGTSLTRKCNPLGPYRRALPRALWWSLGGGAFSYERGHPVQDQHGHLLRPPAGVLVLLGSGCLSHCTLSAMQEMRGAGRGSINCQTRARRSRGRSGQHFPLCDFDDEIFTWLRGLRRN